MLNFNFVTLKNGVYVHFQGGETVTVILSNPLPGMHSKTIQVALGSHDSTKIETEILNEYCFSFKAPGIL